MSNSEEAAMATATQYVRTTLSVDRHELQCSDSLIVPCMLERYAGASYPLHASPMWTHLAASDDLLALALTHTACRAM
jgi:hypothetical protein